MSEQNMTDEELEAAIAKARRRVHGALLAAPMSERINEDRVRRLKELCNERIRRKASWKAQP